MLPTDIFCSGGQLSLLVCYKQAAGSIVLMLFLLVVMTDGGGDLAVVVLVEVKMQLLHHRFDQYEGCF